MTREQKAVIKAAMRWTRASGFVFRGKICGGQIFNVVTNVSAARALEQACAALSLRGKR